MPEYLAPGVYVEEVSASAHPIPGVDTDGNGPLERLRYFNGQRLTAEDLEAEQAYIRGKLRRHNRMLHGWGVASGLVVTAAPTDEVPWRVCVGAGVAICRSGEEVVLAFPARIDLRAHRPKRAKHLFIAVRHGEVLERGNEERFRSGDESPCPDQGDPRLAEPSRIREAIVIGCLSRPLAGPWVLLARVSLPRSLRTRLKDAAIDNVSVRQALQPGCGEQGALCSVMPVGGRKTKDAARSTPRSSSRRRQKGRSRAADGRP